ncbi:sugar phosphate isomerase/epimerase [Sphingobacterium sp. HMA12]|uniref:sugar phosphate isomerase/epimerase family protein n=1 Tax=Sphingobacterium sp. HMA12 TaxID=2050894 RepID=UPI000CEA1D83|nr:TIM barrel protein [Sphingobacterium sp. HMA12]
MKRFLVLILLMANLYTLQAQQQEKLHIKYYCTNWGNADSWDRFCERVKKAGYDGVEAWLPGDQKERKEMIDALQKYSLRLGLLSGGSGSSFEQYRESFKRNLEEAASIKPDYINCHTGKEYYAFEQNKQLIDIGQVIMEKQHIPVYHETHRGRFSFAAHLTKDYLTKIPSLRLALDISHWCNVHESLLADQAEAVSLALARTEHIHARIGHPEGPQVNDPAAPEWKSTVNQHLAWWDEIVAQHKQSGAKVLTITTEFGPAGYLPTLPFTQQPVADQWSVNVYMLNLLKDRYKE